MDAVRLLKQLIAIPVSTRWGALFPVIFTLKAG